MNIFHTIDPTDSLSAVQDAVKAILRRRDERSLSKPWSLAELAPDEEDYEWLRKWGAALTRNVVSKAFAGDGRKFSSGGVSVTYESGFGLLFLFLESELARREATEGSLWPYLCRSFPQARRELFLANRNPTPSHQSSLARAARQFDLRHVFNQGDKQRWRSSIFLQFGFTRKGFTARLPWWLCRQGVSTTVKCLLSTEQGSDTFRKLWNDLRKYRLGELDQDEAKRSVSTNPWVLPEWCDDLLHAARLRLDIKDAEESEHSHSPQDATSAKHAVQMNASPSPFDSEIERNDVEANDFGTEEKQAQEAFKQFTGEPSLKWTHKPFFEIHLDSSHLALTATNYQLFINGSPSAVLTRQSDLTYCIEPKAIRLERFKAINHVRLIEKDSDEVDSIYQSHIELWNEEEEVTIFNAQTGEKLGLDAWQITLDTQTGYVVLATSDLKMDPENECCFLPREAGDWKLHRLSPGWSPQSALLLDETPLWKPLTGASKRESDPLWADSIHVSICENSYESVAVVVSLPSDAQCRLLRVNKCKIDIAEAINGHITSSPISLSSLRNEIVHVWLHIQRDKESIFIKRKISIKKSYALESEDGETWRLVNPNAILTCNEVHHRHWKILLSNNCNGWMLSEGSRSVRGKWIHPRKIHEALYGLGESLVIQYNPYLGGTNSELRLASSVIDTGDIKNISFRTEGDGEHLILRVILHKSIEPDRHYRIVVWDKSAGLVKLEVDDYCGEIWESVLPPHVRQPVIVAASYQGARCGLWLFKPTDDWLLEFLLGDNVHETVWLTRWFKLPALSEAFIGIIQDFCIDHSAQVIKAWTTTPDEYSDLKQTIDDGWNEVIRRVFIGWTPCAETTKCVIGLFDDHPDGEEKVIAAALRLWRCDPFLIGKLLKRWLHEIAPQEWSNGVTGAPRCLRSDNQGICQKLRSLRHAIVDVHVEEDDVELDCVRSSEDRAYQDKRGEIVKASCQHLKITCCQLDALVKSAKEIWDGNKSIQSNLSHALADSEAFRRFITLWILETMEKELH